MSLQSFLYNTPATFPGAIDATHPFSIESVPQLASNPVLLAGQPGVIDSATHQLRPVTAADTDFFGVTVRNFPLQPSSGTNYGATPLGGSSQIPQVGPVDVMRMGRIGVAVSGGGTPQNGGQVYVWTAASTGNHVQGGYEVSATAGSTIAPSYLTWAGTEDAYGNAVMRVRC